MMTNPNCVPSEFMAVVVSGNKCRLMIAPNGKGEWIFPDNTPYDVVSECVALTNAIVNVAYDMQCKDRGIDISDPPKVKYGGFKAIPDGSVWRDAD